MEKEIDINGYDDEELINKYSVQINGKTFIRSSVLNAIGKRRAAKTNIHPGDPGTPENPIFKNGHAYVYSSTNQLIIWEDFPGIIPQEEELSIQFDPETTETFTLTRDMQPTEAQKKMIQKVKTQPVLFSEDCPKSTPMQLERFRKFGIHRMQQKLDRARIKT